MEIDKNNGVKSEYLINLSKDIWEIGKGWVYTSMLCAAGPDSEFDELAVGFKDINGDDYTLRINDNYATITQTFSFTNSKGEKEEWNEEIDGTYSCASVINYIANLPKTFQSFIDDNQQK